MKILMVGDIVGAPGRDLFAQVATRLKSNGEIDAIVVNGENAAGGRGLTPRLARGLIEAGADVITLGDHTWDQREIAPYLDEEPRIVRPANFAQGSPGKGITTVDTPKGPITVINLIGRVFTNPYDCPFNCVTGLLEDKSSLSPVILVDMHAEATSEKIAMGWHLDGRVSAVVGTHTHVQTSDERILPKGTAYLTDLGMTGSKDSVLGCQVGPVLNKFITGMPTRFGVAEENVALEGLIVDVEPLTGMAKSVERVRYQE